MTPETCLTRDDCVRACIASILEMTPQNIPHFFENFNGENADELNRNMQEWLARRGYVAAMIGIPGDWSLKRMLEHMEVVYPNFHFMLWCDSGGDHAVVGCGGEIVHNPAWYKVAIDGPHSSGFWIIWFIARLV